MTMQQIAQQHAQRAERRDAAEFIAFVLDLPQEQFDACTRRRA